MWGGVEEGRAASLSPISVLTVISSELYHFCLPFKCRFMIKMTPRKVIWEYAISNKAVLASKTSGETQASV